MKTKTTVLQSGTKSAFLDRMFSIDYRTLALFRICLGLLILHEFIAFGWDLRAFFSNEGVLPGSFFVPMAKPAWQIRQCSIFFINDSVLFVSILFILGSASCLFYIVGWKTRWANFWMWFFLMSVHVRNPYLIEGFDVYVRFMAFWSLFLPMAEKYAWDAPAKTPQTSERSFATFALMMNVCYLYAFMAYFKFFNVEWLNGQAVMCALQVGDTATSVGAFLMQFPALLTFLTYWTLALETAGPILFFIPVHTSFFRAVAIASFTALQIGFLISLDLLNFPAASMISTIPFIPASWWDMLARYEPARRIGDKAADWLTRPKYLGPAPYRGQLHSWFRIFLSWAALVFSAIVLFLNLVSANPSKLYIPGWLSAVTNPLMLFQKWSAYSERGHFYNYSNWYVVVGTLKDGTQMDIFRNAPVDWQRPESYTKAYRNNPRWRLYVSQAMPVSGNDAQRIYFLSFLIKEWNLTHDESSQAVKAELYQVWQSIRPKPGPLGWKQLASYTPSTYNQKA